ncbi:hypothetical protein CKA55_13345 [Arcobacter suis]|nr:hypothetical protein CKA55_13345 [Arcobacter suis]
MRQSALREQREVGDRMSRSVKCIFFFSNQKRQSGCLRSPLGSKMFIRARLDNAAKKASAFGVELELINADLHDVTYEMQNLYFQTILYNLLDPVPYTHLTLPPKRPR